MPSKEFGKNLPAIRHVGSERAKSNKELAPPVSYYILPAMPAPLKFILTFYTESSSFTLKIPAISTYNGMKVLRWNVFTISIWFCFYWCRYSNALWIHQKLKYKLSLIKYINCPRHHITYGEYIYLEWSYMPTTLHKLNILLRRLNICTKELYIRKKN